ncbi:hypothetical protein B0I35DRAFT_425761 [Stachybotrys elegans]|uniref:Fe2OG dioxygenase domain-containing protein n=1 Tax=Stachybotrys elegans TaxID=80388 RepID=A0A8K0SV09_9HYPO|nr:hypothetical protein B0I35DRAFT_425761 [Stachybotrys elegans]
MPNLSKKNIIIARTITMDISDNTNNVSNMDLPVRETPVDRTDPTSQPGIGYSLHDETYESESCESSSGESAQSEMRRVTGVGGEMSESESSASIEDEGSLGQLKTWLKANYKTNLFTCGGSIPIATGETDRDERPASAHSKASSDAYSCQSVPPTTSHPPVSLRWDPRDASVPASHCKLTLPVDETMQGNVERLLSDMEPATFGRGAKEVYDESYRKASKLSPSSFSTNFCPYKVGIVDVISQLLLPNPDYNRHRAVKAELYNINIYTGPSGHFRPHIDTPRSIFQFGSLVVCLPLEHEGGTLEVRHEGQTFKYDWASGTDVDGPQIQWAAFYSDCEHEVLPVKSGYRITLTYNLLVSRGNGQVSGNQQALDISRTPLYRHIEAIIDDESFLPNGGYIGFCTTHAYPHASPQGILTDTLKGLDMAVWQAFQRLECGVCLRPVLGANPFKREPLKFHVGKKFEIELYWNIVEEPGDWDYVVGKRWGLERVKFDDILWLNKPNHLNRQPSFVYTTYGNEPSPQMAYSACAIIVGIPRNEDGKRMALKETLIFTSKVDDTDWEEKDPYYERPPWRDF